MPERLARSGFWPWKTLLHRSPLFPNAALPLPRALAFRFEVRHLLYGRKPNVYRILFTIEGDTVHVLHIRHADRLP